MRSGHLVIALALLVPTSGCRKDSRRTDKQNAGPLGIASALASMGKPEVAGSLHSVGGSLGTWDLSLDDCQSGDYHGFFGVDLFPRGSSHMRLRYVHDEAAGDIVKVAYPQELDQALVFDRDAKCAVLEGLVEKTNERTRVVGRGDVTHLKGHVKFDCMHSAGKGHVAGQATFAHCH